MITTQKKKITLRDIARVSNISVTAASMALSDSREVSEETRRKVLLLSRKMGYISKRTARTPEAQPDTPRMPGRIGFLYIGMKLDDEVLASTLHNLVALSSERGVRTEVNAIEDTADPQKVAERTLAYVKNLDGLIISGLIDKNLISKLERDGIPYVILGRTLLKNGEDYPNSGVMVEPDVLRMGILATSRLIACGHRRIAFICEIIYKGLQNSQWREGYRLAHLDADLPLDPALVHIAGKELVGGQPAAEAITQMKDPPTAYVIPDVRTAASFIHAMYKKGITLSRESVIIGGKINVAQKYHLEEYPLITFDDKHMVQASLDYLFQSFDRPRPYVREIVIPIITCNLPKPPETNSSGNTL